jgi:hypothetical protein
VQQRWNHSAVYRRGPALCEREAAVLASEVSPEEAQAHEVELRAHEEEAAQWEGLAERLVRWLKDASVNP